MVGPWWADVRAARRRPSAPPPCTARPRTHEQTPTQALDNWRATCALAGRSRRLALAVIVTAWTSFRREELVSAAADGRPWTPTSATCRAAVPRQVMAPLAPRRTTGSTRCSPRVPSRGTAAAPRVRGTGSPGHGAVTGVDAGRTALVVWRAYTGAPRDGAGRSTTPGSCASASTCAVAPASPPVTAPAVNGKVGPRAPRLGRPPDLLWRAPPAPALLRASPVSTTSPCRRTRTCWPGSTPSRRYLAIRVRPGGHHLPGGPLRTWRRYSGQADSTPACAAARRVSTRHLPGPRKAERRRRPAAHRPGRSGSADGLQRVLAQQLTSRPALLLEPDATSLTFHAASLFRQAQLAAAEWAADGGDGALRDRGDGPHHRQQPAHDVLVALPAHPRPGARPPGLDKAQTPQCSTRTGEPPWPGTGAPPARSPRPPRRGRLRARGMTTPPAPPGRPTPATRPAGTPPPAYVLALPGPVA
ncbi:hypothetical protein QJS66_14240 [Kocuria rhizophila]|nr:hypothetical protein QJS66_14240 [Kocuria rhizophila]